MRAWESVLEVGSPLLGGFQGETSKERRNPFSGVTCLKPDPRHPMRGVVLSADALKMTKSGSRFTVAIPKCLDIPDSGNPPVRNLCVCVCGCGGKGGFERPNVLSGWGQNSVEAMCFRFCPPGSH